MESACTPPGRGVIRVRVHLKQDRPFPVGHLGRHARDGVCRHTSGSDSIPAISSTLEGRRSNSAPGSRIQSEPQCVPKMSKR